MASPEAVANEKRLAATNSSRRTGRDEPGISTEAARTKIPAVLEATSRYSVDRAGVSRTRPFPSAEVSDPAEPTPGCNSNRSTSSTSQDSVASAEPVAAGFASNWRMPTSLVG